MIRESRRIGAGNNLRNLHPCFGAVNTKARMHLPICPACNIECGFCRRSVNADENRPGVTSFLLPVHKVAGYVESALEKCEELTVIGVAGPGDALVGDNMFKAFRIIRAAHPELLKCISTNGLLLDERADELIELGIDTLTVTVNAVDPAILARIVFAVRLNGKRLTGVEGAKLLIENQLKGIRKMTAAGTTIKVNTVLIPDLNDAHTEAVAKAVRDAGANIYNIIPLIPQHRFANFAAPSCEQIEYARERAGKHIDVFRHCMHCRADAVGIPGVSEHAAELFGERAEDVFSHG